MKMKEIRFDMNIYELILNVLFYGKNFPKQVRLQLGKVFGFREAFLVFEPFQGIELPPNENRGVCFPHAEFLQKHVHL